MSLQLCNFLSGIHETTSAYQERSSRRITFSCCCALRTSRSSSGVASTFSAYIPNFLFKTSSNHSSSNSFLNTFGSTLVNNNNGYISSMVSSFNKTKLITNTLNRNHSHTTKVACFNNNKDWEDGIKEQNDPVLLNDYLNID